MNHPEPLCFATDDDPFCRRHPWALAHVDDFSSDRTLLAELERLDAVPCHALPPSPLCERCEHALCQCCPRPSCDLFDCECEECEVPLEDWRAWRQQANRAELDDDRVGHHWTTLQDGPWWSLKARQR